jgi:hypothetical protein
MLHACRVARVIATAIRVAVGRGGEAHRRDALQARVARRARRPAERRARRGGQHPANTGTRAHESESAHVDDLGFTLVALFDGFVIVAAIDLGAPAWIVIPRALPTVVIGHRAVSDTRAGSRRRPATTGRGGRHRSDLQRGPGRRESRCRHPAGPWPNLLRGPARPTRATRLAGSTAARRCRHPCGLARSGWP